VSKPPRHATAGPDGVYLPKQSELEKWEQKEAFKRFFEKRRLTEKRRSA